tara:strand:- start:225 stop:464 length:240 start_codon:yes stop_codon:yes gene_type:complete
LSQGKIVYQNKSPIRYATRPPKTEKIVVKKIILKYFSLFAKIYGIRKISVGIGKKIDSMKEIKYKKELVFFFEQKLSIF